MAARVVGMQKHPDMPSLPRGPCRAWWVCAGAVLDPVQVLDALPEEMPLQLAAQTLTRILAERTHRRRHHTILRNLHRARNLAAASDRAEVRPCRACLPPLSSNTA